MCRRIEPLTHRGAAAMLQGVVLVVVGAVGEVHAHLAPGCAMIRVVDVRDNTVLFLAVFGHRDVVPKRHSLALLVGERGFSLWYGRRARVR